MKLTNRQNPEMLPALDNFLSFGKDVFISRPDYVEKMLDIYVTAMSSEQLGEADRANGCKLGESMLLNLRGHIDAVSFYLLLVELFTSIRPFPLSLLRLSKPWNLIHQRRATDSPTRKY